MKYFSVIPKSKFKLILSFLFLGAINLTLNTIAYAEPYLAVRSGQKCLACHSNITGGGKRTEYGTIYGKTALSAEQLITDKATFDGRLNDYFSFGGDFRFNLNVTEIDNQDNSSEFDLQRTSLYLETTLIPNRLSLYIDERFSPGPAVNREAFILYKSKDSTFYSKAGRFFLPLGIRLEDDNAFIKSVTGINFNNSDTGVEFGLEYPSSSTVLAISNGTSGGTENNKKKQFSFRTEYLASSWRLGSSYNVNYSGDSKREIVNIFSGASLFGVDWLFEVDRINDTSLTENIKQYVYLVEANIEIQKGHNLKLSYDYFDPDNNISQNQQTRSSILWEVSPFEFTQIRTGYRHYDGIPQNDTQNRQELFVQLHNYF